MPTDQPLQGRGSRSERIDNAIDAWHDLHAAEFAKLGYPRLFEYLGWTQQEYTLWVERNIPPAPREGAL